MESLVGTRRPAAATRRGLLGGVEGNELVTIGAGCVLTVLLIAEGITLLSLGSLLRAHMFIGLVLIPPVLLKLGSTGYRFARYYVHSRPYVRRGPPVWPLRVLAPVLVGTTAGIFITGVLLLALGHKSDELVFFHKAFFIAWAGVFGIHFLYHAPSIGRSLLAGWRHGRGERVPGGAARGVLVAVALGAGVALALLLLGPITGWHGLTG